MRRLVLFSLLLLPALELFAEPLQITSTRLQWKADKHPETGFSSSQWADGAIKLPYALPASPATARINEVMFLSQLNMPAPREAGKSFALGEGVTPPEGTASLDFSVRYNDGRVLALEINAEGCGAYCEDYQQYFNFDAQTGRFLLIDDILTPRGLSEVGRRFFAERKRLYRQQIRTLRRELANVQKAGKRKKDAVEDTEDRLALNEDCLAQFQETPGDAALRNSLRSTRFILTDKGIVFTAGRCSNHASRALDDVGEVTWPLGLKDLAALLQPYGRYLLTGEGDAAAPVALHGQVLHGKVGSAPITLRINPLNDDNSFSGLYYYDKYRKPISFFGKKTGQRLEFTEDAASGEAGCFTLSQDAAGLSGRWQRQARTLPVRLGW
ncbi:MAG: hypothetical protein H6R15_2774 [Proteobacteria bacterium]|nr:hypothetical protein [Pseudomonadota bacterium]